jgi:hypothetical protein
MLTTSQQPDFQQSSSNFQLAVGGREEKQDIKFLEGGKGFSFAKAFAKILTEKPKKDEGSTAQGDQISNVPILAVNSQGQRCYFDYVVL